MPQMPMIMDRGKCLHTRRILVRLIAQLGHHTEDVTPRCLLLAHHNEQAFHLKLVFVPGLNRTAKCKTITHPLEFVVLHMNR